MASTTHKRVRKTPEQRRAEIAAAATKLIGEKGFYGTSLRDVADAVGMSQPGLLHYVGTKEGLLSLLITDEYDAHGTPADFLASGLPGSDPEAPHFPAYLRYLVRFNAGRRNLVQLHTVLGAESFGEDHPLYEYYENRPESIWNHYSRYQWFIPPELVSWDVGMKPIVRQCIEAMDGIQIRWFRQPPIDLYDEWLTFERMIFPSPIWDRYR